MLFYIGTNAQTKPAIDTGNYYNYYSDGTNIGLHAMLTTNWLREFDVIPVIEEEVEKAGYKYVRSRELYRLSDSQMVILSVYVAKPEFGFYYIGGHAADPQKAHRTAEFWKQDAEDNGQLFSQCYHKPGGEYDCMLIKELPANIFTIHEDCYWFQYTDKPVKIRLVSKADALRILRQDIRKLLAGAPQPAK